MSKPKKDMTFAEFGWSLGACAWRENLSDEQQQYFDFHAAYDIAAELEAQARRIKREWARPVTTTEIMRRLIRRAAKLRWAK